MRPTFYTLDDFIGLANTVIRFVGNDAVQKAIDEIDKQGFHLSESRVALLQQAQPFLIGLGKLQKLIQSGIELSADNLNFEINMLAYAGMLLRSIQDTLPAKLAKAHASRLIDLHGKAHSVVLEWEQASLYRRHGYEVTLRPPHISRPVSTE